MIARERCRHRGDVLSSYSAWTGELWRVRCCDCNDYLSLGPANDASPAVAIERRAAELAAGFRKGRGKLGDGGRWEGRTYLEWLGGSCHSQGVTTLHDPPCLSGWLAREITHATADEGK